MGDWPPNKLIHDSSAMHAGIFGYKMINDMQA
jgi:hypothetical protein